MLERIVFKKVELWIVFLLVLFCLGGAMMFGVMVRSKALGTTRYGVLADAAFEIASIPANLEKSLDEFKKHKLFVNGIHAPVLSKQLFNSPMSSYFKRIDKKFNETGYLLVSGYRPENDISTVYLYSLSENKVLHTWVPPIEEINRRTPDFSSSPNTRSYYRSQHPYLMKNGDVVFSSGEGPLVRVGVCGDLKWVVDAHFHHSIHMDQDGNLVVPVAVQHKGDKPLFRDDGFAVIDPNNGKILREYSLASILIKNGYSGLLLGVGKVGWDHIHLNEAAPILYTDKYVQTGDVMLSSRTLSTVLLYRPSTNKVIWLKTGPWLSQHDISYVGRGAFSIFGNNNVLFIDEDHKPAYWDGGTRIYIYRPATGEVSKPYQSYLTGVYNESEGRQRFLANGDLFIEQTNNNLIRRIGPNGTRWVFVNYVGQRKLGALHWSRYISADEADFPWLKTLNCGT